MHWFSTKLKNRIQGPIPVPFGPNISKHSFSHKKIILLNFKPLIFANFIQKIQKVLWNDFWESWKISFWAHYQPTLAKKLWNNVIPRKIICINFKSLCSNFMQKLRKVSCTDFWWYLKNLTLCSFQAPFSPKTSNQDWSQISCLHHF